MPRKIHEILLTKAGKQCENNGEQGGNRCISPGKSNRIVSNGIENAAPTITRISLTSFAVTSLSSQLSLLFFFAVPTAPFSICSKFLAFPEKRRREKGEMTAGVCMHNEDRRRPGNKETSRWQSDCILRVSTCPANKQTKAIETICYESHISILQIGGLSRKLGTGIGSIKR